MAMSYCRFFEWDRSVKPRQPYFFHFKDDKLPCREDVGVKEEEKEVLGGRMVTMAGLFDIYTERAEVCRIVVLLCCCFYWPLFKNYNKHEQIQYKAKRTQNNFQRSVTT